jgi:hypothetical protein
MVRKLTATGLGLAGLAGFRIMAYVGHCPIARRFGTFVVARGLASIPASHSLARPGPKQNFSIPNSTLQPHRLNTGMVSLKMVLEPKLLNSQFYDVCGKTNCSIQGRFEIMNTPATTLGLLRKTINLRSRQELLSNNDHLSCGRWVFSRMPMRTFGEPTLPNRRVKIRRIPCHLSL